MNISDIMYGMWGLMAYMNATWASSTHQPVQLSENQTIMGAAYRNTSSEINDTTISNLDMTFGAFDGARSIIESFTAQIENFNWIESNFQCQRTNIGGEYTWDLDCILRDDDDAFADLEHGRDLKKASETLASRSMGMKYYLSGARRDTHGFDRGLEQLMQFASRVCPEPTSLDNSTRLSDHDIEDGLWHTKQVLLYLSWTVSDVLLIAGASAKIETLIRGLETQLNRAGCELETLFEFVVAGWTSDHATVKTIRHVANIRNHARHDMSTIRDIISPDVERYLEQQTAPIHDFKDKLLRLRKAWPSAERQQEATKIICYAAEYFGRPDHSKKQDSTIWSKAIGWLNDFFAEE